MSTKRYKVLIADDEYWSRENIKHLIPWELYDIELLDAACDGEEVLERIPEERPDIVMTDVNMPFVDGLELIRQIKEKYPDIITVAISGYDDFEKVKGVFVSGGLDYLLKPVTRQQMTEVLTKALSILEERQNTPMEDRGKSVRMSSFLEDTEMSSLLAGRLYHPNEQVYIPSSMEYDRVHVILVKIHKIQLLTSKYRNDMTEMSYDIKERLRKVLDGVDATVFNFNRKVNEFMVYINSANPPIGNLAGDIAGVFDLDTEGPVTVVVCNEPVTMDNIASCYRNLVSGMMFRPFKMEHFVTGCERVGEVMMKNRLRRSQEKELRRAVAEGKRSAIRKILFDEAGFSHCDDGSWSLLEVTQFLSRVGGIIWSEVEEDNELIQMRDETEEAFRYSQMDIDKQTILDNLNLVIDTVCPKKEISEDATVDDRVQAVRDLIEERYFEHFTLSQIAEKYHVDPSYLSRVFSRKFGESITAMLTRIRIERAKELMRQKNHTLETVSFEVGYDDYNYFSRVFRKNTGESPREYRKRLEKEEK
ncbi:MAG: helix-turn-helix domain-containing protein [Eubacterium sp.]|nr:helix-turn-helix domain-containing protein [Eubacterium sp.]